MTPIKITSFGYGHGNPPRATITIDIRNILQDPHTTTDLRGLTGGHAPVIRHVLATPGTGAIIDNVTALAVSLADGTDQPISIAVGCIGGRQRSVVIADQLSSRLDAEGLPVEVTHLDVERPMRRVRSGHSV